MEICIVLCIYLKCSLFVCVAGGGGRGGGYCIFLVFCLFAVLPFS